MTRLPILLHVVTDETGKMCSTGCPQYDHDPVVIDRRVCRAFDARIDRLRRDRHPDCLAAEAAAREAKASAMERGYEIAGDHAELSYIGTGEYDIYMGAAAAVLGAELARIRGGES